MWFKSYEHFHLLLTDSNSDFCADPRVVQLLFNDYISFLKEINLLSKL